MFLLWMWGSVPSPPGSLCFVSSWPLFNRGAVRLKFKAHGEYTVAPSSVGVSVAVRCAIFKTVP